MRGSCARQGGVVIVWAALLTLAWHSACAQPGPGYESATYHGRKFGIGIDYDVQIRWQDYDAAALQWMHLPQDDIAQTRTQSADQPWIHVALSHRVLGMSATTDTLLQPGNGLAIQRIVRRRRDELLRYKATQYGMNGIRILRIRDEPETANIDWLQARTTYLPYPAWFGDGVAVSDPSALFYMLSRDDLQHPGDTLQMPVFSNDHLVLLELKVKELRRWKSRYIERSQAGEREVRERRPAILIKVDARHLDPDSREEDMEILGMQGDLEILLDASHRVPLRISGRAAKVGKVRLVLSKLELERTGNSASDRRKAEMDQI